MVPLSILTVIVFSNTEEILKDTIIEDLLNVISHFKKIDIVELVHIRADVDCIIMVAPIFSLTSQWPELNLLI